MESGGIGHNVVSLVGRVSGQVTAHVLPSGDELRSFRLVVPRAEAAGKARASVDTIDVACWSARTRRSAERLADGVVVAVEGRLRRGELTVTEVCFAVGFSSLGTFSTRFSELVGMPPSEYRCGGQDAPAGMPPCMAKRVTRPVRNREAAPTGPGLA